MATIEIIGNAANKLSEAISKLLVVCSFTPVWDNKFVGWRHRDEHKEVSLYWLTKLAGISSTIQACVKLAAAGYWFQVAILARTITEAQLSIVYTFPKADMKPGDWPNSKQKKEIESHFMETWGDPNSPYENDKLRSHIRDLAASIGHFQIKPSEMNPHDASQSTFQYMRFLSDYTHMAYPQLMDLFEEGRGYVLMGNQKKSLFRESDLGHLLSRTYTYAETVTELLGKVISACGEKARVGDVRNEKVELFQEKYKKIMDIHRMLIEEGKAVDAHFPASDAEVRKTLKTFKKR